MYPDSELAKTLAVLDQINEAMTLYGMNKTKTLPEVDKLIRIIE